MMIDWLIIYKNKENKATAKERREYVLWLKKSHRHARYAEKLNHYHQSQGHFTPLNDAQLMQNFTKLQTVTQENNTHNRSVYRRRILTIVSGSVAAVILISFFVLTTYFAKQTEVPTIAVTREIKVPTLILGGESAVALEGDDAILSNCPVEKVGEHKIAYNRKERGTTTDTLVYNALVVPSHYTYTIILDDSTEVHLNTNSELRYPVSFTGEKREVFLKGEAYFKVMKDKKPFIVTTDEITVRVYGTEFNINTLNKENIKATLLSGAVGVTIQSAMSEEIAMVPNQKFILNSISWESKVVTIDPENDVAWRNGTFKCDNEKLSVLLNEIANWYGVEFHYANAAVKNIPVSVKLKNTTDLNNIIRAMEMVSGTKIIKTSVGKYVIE